jgi:hypothetical protein
LASISSGASASPLTIANSPCAQPTMAGSVQAEKPKT